MSRAPVEWLAGVPGRTPATGRPEWAATARPEWAEWNTGGEPYTIGIEEEVLLIDPLDQSLAEQGDQILGELPEDLRRHVAPETHAGVVELISSVHASVPAAIAELRQLRRRLAAELHGRGLAAAGSGLHPFGPEQNTRTSAGRRYRAVSETMRSLARREPTAALHVHVGVPDPEAAVRLMDGFREALPVLMALSANSPFSQGRDSGFASMRNRVFCGFPRTGVPRSFAGYADYVRSIEPLIVSGALPDPTFLWWDVRLQPALGTVEVRVMDAQSNLADTAALSALVHSLARLSLQELRDEPLSSPEVLAENCFLAARDGVEARLIEPVQRRLVPLTLAADGMLRACRRHARALGCSAQLEGTGPLALINGAKRQRAWVRSGRDLRSLLPALAEQFAAEPETRAFSSALSPSNDRSP